VDEDGENGGVPGGNIRNAFLYNEDRVALNSVETLESDVLASKGVTNPNAFDGTRDPLLGVFEFNGQEITLINNHMSSRFGSTPVFGGPQPFVQAGEAEREEQAKALNEVVDGILGNDPEARVSVLGDLNTFEFTDELAEDLPGVGDEKVLTNLIDKVETDDAYSFIFDGNSQALDHIFVTDALLEDVKVDYVHVNLDFQNPASDHEPILASFEIKPDGKTIIGDADRNKLEGTNGDDLILGLDGRDKLYGRLGDDKLFGGAKRDRLFGEEGDDHLHGGTGRDVLNGGADDDRLVGRSGADTFIFEGDFGKDVIRDYQGLIDTILIIGADIDDLSLRSVDRGTWVSVDGDNAEGKFFLRNVTDVEADDFLFI